MLITIANNGPKIVETNYWDSEHAAQGLMYLSWNAGAGRLLLPDSEKSTLREVKSAKYVVVSRGPWPAQGQKDAIELLFEDHTDTPYCINLSMAQTDRILADADGKDLFLTLWTRKGQQAMFPAKYRTVSSIPCMKAWGT